MRSLLAAVSLLATTTIVAAEPAIVLPAANTFDAGSLITVRWTNLPTGVEELEFFLIRGDVREEIVRLTPQLVPERGSFQWRVPDLPAEGAFLRLRVGIDGVEHNVADSRTFTILGAREAQLVFRDGEWWVSNVVCSTAARAVGAHITLPRVHDNVATIAPRRAGVTLPRLNEPIDSGSRAIHSAFLSLAVMSCAPLVVPQRK